MKTVIVLIIWASPKLAKTIHAQEQAIDKALEKSSLAAPPTNKKDFRRVSTKRPRQRAS